MKKRHLILSVILGTTFLFPNAFAKTETETETETEIEQQSLLSNNQVNIQNSLESNKLLQQRKIYLQIKQLLKQKVSADRDAKIKNLLTQIKTYPLYNYARFQLLAQQPFLSLKEINQLQKIIPAYLTTKYLKQNWLIKQQKSNNWGIIKQYKNQIPQSLATRCIVKNADFQLHKKKNNKQALQQLEKMGVAKLWVSGSNLPNSCDPLFKEWGSRGGMTNGRIYQRAIYAFEKNNLNLLRYLAKISKNTKTKKAINDLIKLKANPKLLLSSKNQFNANHLSTKSSNDRRILIKTYPAFVRSLKEEDINPKDPFSTPAKWIKKFKLNDHRYYWKSLMVSHFFDSPNPQIQQWRDNTILSLKSDKQIERRIRLAIRQQKGVDFWINQLSAKAQNKAEWRYWKAESLWKKGKKQEAEKIFTQLQQGNRGFYPMLAAHKLGLKYSPNQKNFKNPELVKQLKQRYQNYLTMVNELRATQESTKLYSAWLYLLGLGDNSHKLALSEIAAENKWYDLQVEATIQAKAWAYLPLRLPNAYTEMFTTFLKHKQIKLTFAMAIARQESAWKPRVSSHANARGLMQLLPSTAKRTAKNQGLPYHSAQQLLNPSHNIMLGTSHLQELYDKYGDNRILIAAAYNAGPHRVDNWLTRSNGKLSMAEFVATIPYYETRGYVQNVLTYDYYYQKLQGKPMQKFTQTEKTTHY